jgi:hypothetical protein
MFSIYIDSTRNALNWEAVNTMDRTVTATATIIILHIPLIHPIPMDISYWYFQIQKS